jgi:hypothetical protein
MDDAVSITLNSEERQLLFDILEERQRMLIREIDHTDHHDFKAGLRKKERLLESLLSRVELHA